MGLVNLPFYDKATSVEVVKGHVVQLPKNLLFYKYYYHDY